MNIAILFGGECPLPPEAIGAVEIRWYNVGLILAGMGHSVTLIGKGGTAFSRNRRNFKCTIVPGFIPSRHRLVTLFRALVNSAQMLRLVTPCDILVVNNAWAMLLMRFWGRRKFRRVVVNVARMPKVFFWFRNKGADVFVCPTAAVARHVKNLIPATMHSKVCVVPNPVDTVSFNSNSGHSVADSKKIVIAYHGRINREKGLHVLAEAVRGLIEAYPDIRLKLIGPVSEAQGGSGVAYKRELDEILGNHLHWVAPISDRAALARELLSCTIYCYPSLAENGETFGVAPLEAMGLGLPVVVSALECFSDFVKDDENGLIFDHRNSEPATALKACLERLLSDIGLRRRIAAAAASSAKCFSTENIAAMYSDLFQRMLRKTDR